MIDIERATVRWVDGNDFGLDFVRLSPLATKHIPDALNRQIRVPQSPPKRTHLFRSGCGPCHAQLLDASSGPLLYSDFPARWFMCSPALPMLEPQGKIWMDGSFVDWADAQVHVMTHSLHYGLAVFEGIRCYKGTSGSAIFRLQEHVDRLFDSAHIGMMQMPFDKKQVAAAIVETVRVNKLGGLLYPPARLYRARSDGGVSRRQPDQAGHCGLDMGLLPR